MKKFKIIAVEEISLSDEEISILKRIKEEGYAEFRDIMYEDYDDYIESSIEQGIKNARSRESWNKRNFHGLNITSLNEKGLLDYVDESWHTTYKVGELGEYVLQMLDEGTSELKI